MITMKPKIWERYLLKQFLRMFFLFLICFYGLYVLIDYANHSHHFIHQKGQSGLEELFLYYAYVFASRSEILIPFALLIAFIQTIYSLNSHHELVAFMAGGFSLKMLMRPFILMATLCMILIYTNEEFVLPQALKKLRYFEDAAKHKKNKRPNKLTAQHILLEDGSLFIFQNYDSAKERFFDAYWIQSIDNIYRIKFLCPFLSTPKGYFVDHLIRYPNGEMFQTASFEEFSFPEMKFQPNLLQSTLIDPDMLPPIKLFIQSITIPSQPNEKESKVLTAFYWKLVMPWLCLLAILAPAPYCVRFSRHLPIFLVYVGCLFGLIAFYMFMDAAQVAANKQIIPPFWAICFPFLLIFSYFGWRFKNIESG